MSSRRTFKKFFSTFFTKVSCRCGCQEYRKRQAKRIVLQKDALTFTNVHFCANVYKHLSNRGDAIYIQKPWEIHTFFGGRRKIWFLNQTLKNFQNKKKTSSESFFRQRRFRRGVKKTIGIAEQNALRWNIMYYLLNKSHEFIKSIINDVKKSR